MPNTTPDQPTNQPPTHAEMNVFPWMQNGDRVLNESVPEMVEERAADLPGLVELLKAIRELKALLRDAEQVTEDALAELLTHEKGWWAETRHGMAKCHSGKKRTHWDHPSVDLAMRHVIAMELPEKLVDPDEGLVYETSDMLAGIWKLLRLAETPSWKITGLKALQLDPDQFCTTDEGRKTVELG